MIIFFDEGISMWNWTSYVLACRKCRAGFPFISVLLLLRSWILAPSGFKDPSEIAIILYLQVQKRKWCQVWMSKFSCKTCKSEVSIFRVPRLTDTDWCSTIDWTIIVVRISWYPTHICIGNKVLSCAWNMSRFLQYSIFEIWTRK